LDLHRIGKNKRRKAIFQKFEGLTLSVQKQPESIGKFCLAAPLFIWPFLSYAGTIGRLAALYNARFRLFSPVGWRMGWCRQCRGKGVSWKTGFQHSHLLNRKQQSLQGVP
jgi:hypothetical protein